ncbi:MAG: homoserine dehydrogenase [Gemmatimonadaceae bacterium]
MTPQQQLQIDEPCLIPFPVQAPGSRSHHHPSRVVGGVARFESQAGEQARPVRIALAGCGVVGSGLVRLLDEAAPAIAARFGVRFVITRILVRDRSRDRGLPIESHLFTDNIDSFLDEDADVVIEAIGGDEPARRIGTAALARGRKFITANKQLVASHGDGLCRLARHTGSALDFGAAVGGSAPVISTLRDLVGATTPRSVRGVLNGTSNYVISHLEHGLDLQTAINRACERGLAESDCERDLDGTDAAAKLAIIGWIAFGIVPSTLHIRRTPLTPGLEKLTRFVTHVGGRLRFIAECTRLSDCEVTAAVEPVVVAADSAFGRTLFEENRVEIDLGWTSPLSVSGPGAGAAPTAAALLSDLLRESPPPNERGAKTPQFVSVPDGRERHWLVVAGTDASVLREAVAAIGHDVVRLDTHGTDAGVVTAPTTWAQLQILIADLESRGIAPCVARYELTGTKEVQR